VATAPLRLFLTRLRCFARPERDDTLSDPQLLERFVTHRDEAAFEVLVWRHGGMVLDLCRRLLRNAQDAEDVFQATFLALARKAGSIGKRESLASWLYKVAYRVAMRVRSRVAKYPGHAEDLLHLAAARHLAEPEWSDLRPILDEEIDRLPEKHRTAVVLCYLQGKTLDEAARQLGCPRGTVSSRLSRARERLRLRLTRRGLALSVPLLAALLSRNVARAALPASLITNTARAAGQFASPQAATGSVISHSVVTLAEGVLRAMFVKQLRIAGVLLLILTVVGVGAGVLTQQVQADKPAPREAPALVGADSVRLPSEMPANLGIQVGEVKARPTAATRTLILPGVLTLDPDRLTHVRSLFPGILVELGKIGDRTVLVGDRVRKDQVLAVVWSKDLAEKKGELVDALVQLALDRKNLQRIEEVYKTGAAPEASLRQARRTVEADENAVARAERTLRVWRLSDDEIKAVQDEAERIGQRQGKRDAEVEKAWARVELRAPLDGTVLERNVAVGEVADTTHDFFKIADVSRLLAVAQIDEKNLAALRALPPEKRKWTIRVVADEDATPIEGPIDRIGDVIDPTTGMTTLSGAVNNAKGTMRAGQFVRLDIALPPAGREVVLPAGALVEQGGVSLIFVQPDPKKAEYQARPVLVVRRGQDVIHVRSELTADEQKQGYQPLRPGERIVTAGAVELMATLDDLRAKDKK
jgi:cobalt-zinc-cadmium efflux system membrane fusion protein